MIAAEKIKIKVCGMRDANNITQVTALGPDYMGFIFYPPSPRYVGADFKLSDKDTYAYRARWSLCKCRERGDTETIKDRWI